MRVRVVTGVLTLVLALGCSTRRIDDDSGEHGGTSTDSSPSESTGPDPDGTTGMIPDPVTTSSTEESSGTSTEESSGTSTEESSGTSTEESGVMDESGSETGDMNVPPDCELDELNDQWEPNPSADQATIMPWEYVYEGSSVGSSYIDAYLCPGDDDWYAFDSDSLGYEIYMLRIRVLVKDATLCGQSCDGPVIPAGPEHALQIDVHRADTLELLYTIGDDDGVQGVDAIGEEYSHDLLIHIHSPTPDAEYSYRMTVSLHNYDGEDECEC